MKRASSLSSIASVSSESLNINSAESTVVSNKEESFKVCIEEFSAIHKGLNDKLKSLKQWELDLQSKEEKITCLCKSVNKYIEYELSTRTKDVVNEIERRYCELEKNYNSLSKDHKRVQSAFQTIKSQNKSLKMKLEDLSLKEEILRKGKEKLFIKMASKSNSSGCRQTRVGIRSVSTQTVVVRVVTPNCTPDLDSRLDTTFSSIFHTLWQQIFQVSMNRVATGAITTVDPEDRSRDSFADVCLLVIPPCVEYLRDRLAGSDIEGRVVGDVRSRLYLEVLHWSLVYLDTRRLPLRHGLLSPLTRLGEDLAALFVPRSGSPPPIKKVLNNDNELHALIIVLAARNVNQTDLLSLVVQHLIDIIDNCPLMCSLLLSKSLYTVLLCRWSTSSSLHCTLYPKILNIVFHSLPIKLSTCQQRCSLLSTIHLETGLDALIFLLTKSPISVSTSTSTNGTHLCHPLVFLIDVLHSSVSEEGDAVLGVIECIVTSRAVREIARDLGLVGVVSHLLSQQMSPERLHRLRALLGELA